MEKFSVDEIRRIEEEAAEAGISEESLMEHAGFRVSEFLRNEFSRELEFAFICGPGNNGGDGFVAARRLSSLGFDVQVYSPSSGFSALAERKLGSLRVQDGNTIKRDFPSANIYVDALLGYGMDGSPREPVASAVEKINSWSAETVSIDVPTGVDPDTGQRFSPSVNPDFTVSLGLPKKGLRPENSGEIHLADIGIPSNLTQEKDFKKSRIFSEGSLTEL